MPDTLATIIATAVALGWLLLMVCAAVLIGHLFAGPPEVMLADTFAEHEDEAVLESHPGWREARDGDTPGQLEPQLIVAYAEQDYAAICKTCTPRMGVRP